MMTMTMTMMNNLLGVHLMLNEVEQKKLSNNMTDEKNIDLPLNDDMAGDDHDDMDGDDHDGIGEYRTKIPSEMEVTPL